MCSFLSHSFSMWHYPEVDKKRKYAPGMVLVLATRQREVFQDANSRMTAAGMPLTLVGQEEVSGSGVFYWLTFVRVLPPPSSGSVR